MATLKRKVHIVIHAAATAAGAVGAGLAQLPGSDAPVLMGIQTAMIMGVADLHGEKITKATATDLLLTFTATQVGRGISQFLVGWIPVLGNALNAATAAGVTEAVGWAAHAFFEKNETAPAGAKE
jgi:uncharacterized protein (DUF697 family)